MYFIPEEARATNISYDYRTYSFALEAESWEEQQTIGRRKVVCFLFVVFETYQMSAWFQKLAPLSFVLSFYRSLKFHEEKSDFFPLFAKRFNSGFPKDERGGNLPKSIAIHHLLVAPPSVYPRRLNELRSSPNGKLIASMRAEITSWLLSRWSTVVCETNVMSFVSLKSPKCGR